MILPDDAPLTVWAVRGSAGREHYRRETMTLLQALALSARYRRRHGAAALHAAWSRRGCCPTLAHVLSATPSAE